MSAAARLEEHGEMMKLLDGEYGVTLGFANTIAILYRQQAGAKAGLKPKTSQSWRL